VQNASSRDLSKVYANCHDRPTYTHSTAVHDLPETAKSVIVVCYISLVHGACQLSIIIHCCIISHHNKTKKQHISSLNVLEVVYLYLKLKL